MEGYHFGHEKLTVYQNSLDFIEWINSKVFAHLAKRDSVYDQLDRASTSIPLNIAEGNGKHTSKDKCRYFYTAWGSALECAACLDILDRKKMIDKPELNEGKLFLKEIVSMLIGLIRANSNRAFEKTGEYDA